MVVALTNSLLLAVNDHRGGRRASSSLAAGCRSASSCRRTAARLSLRPAAAAPAAVPRVAAPRLRSSSAANAVPPPRGGRRPGHAVLVCTALVVLDGGDSVSPAKRVQQPVAAATADDQTKTDSATTSGGGGGPARAPAPDSRPAVSTAEAQRASQSAEYSAETTMGEYAVQLLRQRLRQADKIYKRSARVPRLSTETVHDLRVAFRRLRTSLRGLSFALKLPKLARAQRLSPLVRAVGVVRDLDVLQETMLTAVGSVVSQYDRTALFRALNDVSRRRAEALAEAQEVISGKSIKRSLRVLSSTLAVQPRQRAAKSRISDLSAAAVGEAVPVFLLQHVFHLFLHPAWTMTIESVDENAEPQRAIGRSNGNGTSARGTNGNRFSEGDGPAAPSAGDRAMSSGAGGILGVSMPKCAHVHDLRKAVREVRYEMEAFAPLYGGRGTARGDDYAQGLADLEALQAAIGEMRDVEVCAEALPAAAGASMPEVCQALRGMHAVAWDTVRAARQKLYSAQGKAALCLAIIAQPAPGAEVAAAAGRRSRSSDSNTNWSQKLGTGRSRSDNNWSQQLGTTGRSDGDNNWSQQLGTDRSGDNNE